MVGAIIFSSSVNKVAFIKSISWYPSISGEYDKIMHMFHPLNEYIVILQ